MLEKRRGGLCFRANKCTKLVRLGDTKRVAESLLKEGKLRLKKKVRKL